MKKKILNWILLLAIAFLLPVLCAELALRLLPRPRFAANIVFDSLLGHTGPKGVFVDFLPNRIYFNQFGYRDRPYDPKEERNNGQIRIAALGDSITEAVANSESEVWTKWTVNILNSALKSTFSIYRFASSDWGTYQEALALERDAQKIDPHVVLLQFLGLNDFINNGIAFAEKNRSENDAWRPYFNVELPLNEPIYLNPEIHFLRKFSAIFRFFDAYYVNKYIYGIQAVKDNSEACDAYVELFLENNRKPAWQQAFAATNGIAKKISGLIKPGQLFVAVYFPSPLESSKRLWNEAVVEPMKKCAPGSTFDRSRGEMIFEAAFKAAGIETFSLLSAFQKAQDPEKLFDQTGHLSARGHQLAGEQIAFHLFNKHSARLGGRQ